MGKSPFFLLFTALKKRKHKKIGAKIISALKSSVSSSALNRDGNIAFLDFTPTADLEKAVLMEALQSEWTKHDEVYLSLAACFLFLTKENMPFRV